MMCKNFIKKLTNIILLTALTVLIVFPVNLMAEDLSLTTYYPALSGEYERIQFLPRSVNLTNPCTVGTVYVNSTNTIQYCHANSGVGNWGPVTDVWTQNGDDIFPTDTLTQPNLFVGIGTKTPEFKLSIQNDAGIIAKGTFGSGNILPGLTASSRLIWYPRKTAFRAGHVSGAQWDDGNIGNYSAALGKNSTASGNYSVVGGGDSNTASGNYSNVIGGQNNTASGDYSSIIGGFSNTATQQYAIATGGASNQATANYATIVGGQSNTASAIYTTVGGGSTNTVSTPYSNINGGQNNIINQILGLATGYSVIGGGYQNQARNNYAVISGGSTNTVIAPYNRIGGGLNNSVGRFIISVDGLYSQVSGGEGNKADANNYSTISGGLNNKAGGVTSTVGGGWGNTASGDYSAIGGGERNTTSHYSMIMGGTDNIINSSISWAGGKNMQLTAAANHTFVWGYSDTPISIATTDAFIIAPGTIGGNPWNPKVGIRDINPVGVVEINANGTSDGYIYIKKNGTANPILNIKLNDDSPIKKTYIGINRPAVVSTTDVLQIGTDSSNGNGAYLTKGGSWSLPSSRRLKENIHPLTLEKAQNTLDQLNPVTFNYKVKNHPNVGFIAEDVPDSVAMKDRKSLSSMDIIAVLTKVAQDQESMIQTQANKIIMIQTKIDALQKILDK